MAKPPDPPRPAARRNRRVFSCVTTPRAEMPARELRSLSVTRAALQCGRPNGNLFLSRRILLASSRARIFQIDGGRADVANWRTRGAEDGSHIRRLSEIFNKAGDFEVEPNSLVRRAIVPRVRSPSRSRRAK